VATAGVCDGKSTPRSPDGAGMPAPSPLLTSTRRSTCAPDTITLRRSSPAQGHLFLAVVYWLRTALLTTHMPHSMRSRVCETIRCPFVCPSVCLSQYGPTAANLLWARRVGDIDRCCSSGVGRAVPRCQRTCTHVAEHRLASSNM